MTILYFLKPQYESPGVKETYHVPDVIAGKEILKKLKKRRKKKDIINEETLDRVELLISEKLKYQEDEDLMILSLIDEGLI